MDSPIVSQFATWSTPRCPFTIAYSLRVLDDIRLAVMDAFFSLPRGGAEIGGILLGTRESNGLRILDYAPLECEHAFGPSFTLSDRDHAKLAELLGIARRSGGGNMPLGWYHSHTRSEVFFSDADIAIHKQFFPAPWQVALVLKPHTFEPTRAGFFFREVNGSIHGASSYCEFTLEPQMVQPAMSDAVAAPVPVPDRPMITTAALEPKAFEAETAPRPIVVPTSESPREQGEIRPPSFLDNQSPVRRRWGWVLAGLAIAGVGAGGYQTRSSWLPPLESAIVPAPQPKPAAVRPAAPAPTPKPAIAPVVLGLTTADQDGQLHISWDRNSTAIRNGAAGILSIAEGPKPFDIPLDQAHLQTGSFTYGRRGARVDVSLTVQSRDGRSIREVATFIGAPPERPAPEGVEARKQRDDLVRQAAKLKSDLNKQAERTKQLQDTMDQMRLELLRQQRTRMENMSPDVPKAPARKQ